MFRSSVAVLFNPISGKGNGKRIAKELSERLISCGMTVFCTESNQAYKEGKLLDLTGDVDAIVVVGGDGTLAGILLELGRTNIPVYMLPAGNESLFARHFSMSWNIEKVIDVLGGAKTTLHSFGLVNDKAFFSMASIGLDSEIIARIAGYRKAAIGHVGYIVPGMCSFITHKVPYLSVKVDGQLVLKNNTGFIIIANVREYALGLDPVPEADSGNQILHARFFPCRSRFDYILWAYRCWRGGQVNTASASLLSGRCFEIFSEDSRQYPVQADGEFVGDTPVKVSVSSDTLRVLA
jgi:diacylglycerol kinase family enzyme